MFYDFDNPRRRGDCPRCKFPMESLRAHDEFWLRASRVRQLRTWGSDPSLFPDPPAWDYQALAAQARHDLGEIEPLLETVLDRAVLGRVMTPNALGELNDELWVRIVYAFAAATGVGRTGIDHLADMFTPLYMWRAAAFMSAAAAEAPAALQLRLNGLCDTFERLKPLIVAAWTVKE